MRLRIVSHQKRLDMFSVICLQKDSYLSGSKSKIVRKTIQRQQQEVQQQRLRSTMNELRGLTEHLLSSLLIECN